MKDINNEFASAGLTAGQLNAIVKKLGGHEKALAFLRGEITISKSACSWTEKDGVIYLAPVVSNGRTGQEWLDHFVQKGVQVSDWAKSIILHADFNKNVTKGIVTGVAVLKGMLWNNRERITKNIKADAEKRHWYKLSAEHICLMRDKLSDEELKEMGLNWIVGMHEPIPDSVGDLDLLCLDRDSDGPWLDAHRDEPDFRWGRNLGFAFVISQASLEA